MAIAASSSGIVFAGAGDGEAGAALELVPLFVLVGVDGADIVGKPSIGLGSKGDILTPSRDSASSYVIGEKKESARNERRTKNRSHLGLHRLLRDLHRF